MNPEVSVIIPVYNGEAFITQTVQSVLDQTYDNWELILVNDGSTDGTPELLNNLTDDRIRVVNQENQGVSVARNTGAKNAKGSFLAFLDADDRWLPSYLSTKMEFARAHPDAGMFLCKIACIDQNDNRLPQTYHPLSHQQVKHITEFRGQYSTLPSNILCTRAAFEKTAGFRPELSNAADTMFYAELSRVTKSAVIKQELVLYRFHDNSMHYNVDLMVRDYLTLYSLLKAGNFFSTAVQARNYRFKTCMIAASAYRHAGRSGLFLHFVLKAFFTSPINFLAKAFSLRNFVFNTINAVGITKGMLRKNRRKSQVPILLFHRITKESDPCWEPITPGNFEKIIAFLGSHYRFLPLADLFTKPAEELKDACFVCFDDGWQDFEGWALPILQRHNVPVTLFVSAENTARNEAIWTSKIDQVIGKTEGKFHFKPLNLNLSVDTDTDRMNLAQLIKNQLNTMHIEQRNELLHELLVMHDYDPSYDWDLMNWEALKKAKEQGVEIESHTLTHPYLTNCSDDELIIELCDSKNTIEEQLEKQVKYLAYPMGGYDERVLKETEEHYDAAFAVDDDLVDLKRVHQSDYRFRIPRFNIHHHNPKEVFALINGFHSKIRK